MALTNKLTNIADAIRTKTGSSATMTLDEMAAAIGNIEGGGAEPILESITISENGTYTPDENIDGYNEVIVNVESSGGDDIPDSEKVVTGNLNYKYYADNWTWFLEKNKGKISIGHITGLSHIFDGCTNLSYIPDIEAQKPSSSTKIDYLFSECNSIKEIPISWEDLDFGYLNNSTSMGNNLFYKCYSLKHISPKITRQLFCKATTPTSSPYGYTFGSCINLREVLNLGVPTGVISNGSSLYNTTFSGCFNLNRMTFDTNDDGTAKTASFKSATLDLTNIATRATNVNLMIEYGSDLNYQIYDDETYALYKNHPEAWSSGGHLVEDSDDNMVLFDANVVLRYARYNHDSAVETINSLPDTSAYGTNTIKFKGEAGSATDGGAINTMTADEIAVAAAKGWTVTFV